VGYRNFSERDFTLDRILTTVMLKVFP